MKPEYRAWIKATYPTTREALGECMIGAKAMGIAFPELRVTNGFVTILGDLEPRQHWWCVTPDDQVVDPTAIQYPLIMDYEEIDDGHPARNYRQARCHDCGEYYYETPELKGTMHTPECERAYMAYLNTGIA